MGSKSDEYFLERYKQGEREAILLENSPLTQDWIPVFSRIARELGFVPSFYSGASRSVRPQGQGISDTLDDQLTDDFYPARTKILCFGPSKNNPADYEDHWALKAIPHIPKDSNTFVYITNDFPEEIIRKHGFQSKPTAISSADEFGIALRRDLGLVTARK